MPASDFDLCARCTRIRHGRLERRLAGCDLGGGFDTDTLANEIEGRPFQGLSLRLHDAAAGSTIGPAGETNAMMDVFAE